jgi:alpha-amylase
LKTGESVKFIVPVLILLFLPSTFAQSVPVTFRVNMSYQIEQGKFNPVNEFVDLAGTFNNWGSQVAPLSDPDGDKIYERVVTGFTPSVNIQFKFRINGQWNGREEFPGGGPNRTYTVRADSNIVEVWYNDEFPPTGPPVAGFTVNTPVLFNNAAANFKSSSMGLITEYKWFFEGGNPAASNEKNPVVYYSVPGKYDVTLIVSNAEVSDTLTKIDFIEVKERNTGEAKWWNDRVFYEVFVRSFFDSNGDGIGDFNGLTQKLDYLNDGNPNTSDDLGITGIWLMPINSSPSYHGYDVIDYRRINPQYGTMNDFKNFLNAAKQRGIKVIIDYVMNHSSTQNPWFQQSAQNNPLYRNFYRWEPTHPGVQGPFGQAWHSHSSGFYYGVFWSGMPDLNYENPAVKDTMFAIADYWLNEIGVDGFRLDAVLYLVEEGTNYSNTQGTFNLLSEFTNYIKTVKPDAFSVGEAWTDTETVINYVNNNVLDYCFEFDLASATLSALKTGNAQGLVSQMQKVYNLYPHLQYGTFLSNHDQNRVMNELQNDKNKAKVAAALYLTFPGIPYLYYGEEIGMTGVKPDENIRTPMQWANQTHAGFTTGNPWRQVNNNYPTINVATQQADSASLLNWYKKLIALRNNEPALRVGEFELVVSATPSVAAFLRHYDGRSILVINNTSNVPQNNLNLKILSNNVLPGNYIVQDLLKNINVSMGVNNLLEIQGISVGGLETKIYSFANSSISGVEGVNESVGFMLSQNYPNPFNPATEIAYTLVSAGSVKLKVYNVLGAEVATLVDEFKGAGVYKVGFNGAGLTSGVYFYRLTVDNRGSDVKKMVILK